MRDSSRFPIGARWTALAAAAAALVRGAALVGLRPRRASSASASQAGPAGAIVLQNSGRNDGPPDLDELWRDFNKKLSGLFGGKGGPGPQRGGDERPPGGGGNFQPDFKSAGIGAGLIGVVALLVWLGSGFFIVQEGQQAVVTTFGRFSHTVDAGFQWRMPYPVQAHEVVSVTQLQSVEVGRTTVAQATGLRESSMLTQDENIVDIRFTVQYRRADARAYLFENRNADEAVVMAAESAVREIVGSSKIDSVLYERRDAIAADLVKSIQAQLDRLKAGIVVANVNLQNVQVPDAVQAAFNDAVKAGADRDRLINEGRAYASDVIPRARGAASRLLEEAEGYRARVEAQAEGDAQRFRAVLAEYQKAPQVTRDRIYLETMQQVYANVSKVLVDSRSGSNLLYLPLDRLLQQAGATTTTTPMAAPPESAPLPSGTDIRSRDGARTRDREGR